MATTGPAGTHGGKRNMAEHQDSTPTQDVPQLQDLLKRAIVGDPSTLEELRLAFEKHPGLWREAGDLSKLAEKSWVTLAAGKDLTLAEALPRKLAELRAHLADGSTDPLEALVI